ncbi:glycoside hydrolase family 32 protein [Sphingomonas sp. AP4-R1]|uniref:glycoside hydrolase family 32 protein n=1 Tax=Sphingomonas sp. AP4-R1 TaxID=2735134 RepID=UPI0020A5D3A2|nr:glycoside hydrolase family 32 protein [Sphingomonas sp. AP4-R1]
MMDKPATVRPDELHGGDADEARYRPSLHFAPRRNWMNDPNGLVYFAGEYHLYFQYNPYGDQWGHMSWGHAVSRDLVTWEELPVAMAEREREMIFSGSIVVDRDNVSGFGDGNEPPLLAFYTGFDAEADIQRQCLAYSNDRGRTFTFYTGNPLIDLGMAHFRDPKVFRHEPSNAWVMSVALAREHKVQFYRSTDLLSWELASAFGPSGATTGQWECPDLIAVPLEDNPDASRWVLKVDVDADFVGGGSGAQYFVGEFDGWTFTVDPAAPHGDIVDFGPDFYAAVTWSDLPADQPGPLWVGWMSNHQTGRFYPTEPWRGAQSLPRTLFLFGEDGRLRLGQRPVSSAVEAFPAALQSPDEKLAVAWATTGAAFRATASLTLVDGVSDALQVLADGNILLGLHYDGTRGLVFRRGEHGGLAETSFGFTTDAPYQANGSLAIELFFDGCLVDLFVDGGRRVYSCSVFPIDPRAVDVQLGPARL